jgi:hypothetical protein
VTSLSGTNPFFFSSLRMSFSAARLFLLLWTSTNSKKSKTYCEIFANKVLKACLGADSRLANTDACREWTGKPAHDAPAIAAIVGVCREWLKSQEQKPRAATSRKRQSDDKGRGR